MRIDGLTIEEYEELPAALAVNHELEDGTLVEVSGNTYEHNELRDLLAELLRAAVRKSGSGRVVTEQEFNFHGNAHGPDISLIAADDVGQIDRRRRVQPFVPRMAIEIVSENDIAPKLMKKAARYRSAGTKEVWIFFRETRHAMHFTKTRQVILNENDRFQPESVPDISLTIGEVLDLQG